MVKTIIAQQGVVQYPGEGIEFEGVDYHEAPFRNRWLQTRAITTQGTGSSQLTHERYRDTGFFMDFFRHNQTDAFFGMFQLPNSWDETTAIIPHIHVIPMSDGSGAAYFTYAYAWVTGSGMLDPGSHWTSGSFTMQLTAAQQYHMLVYSQSIDPPVGSAPGNMFFFKVERGGDNDLDTYTTAKDHETAAANIAFIAIDILFQLTRAGQTSPNP